MNSDLCTYTVMMYEWLVKKNLYSKTIIELHVTNGWAHLQIYLHTCKYYLYKFIFYFKYWCFGWCWISFISRSMSDPTNPVFMESRKCKFIWPKNFNEHVKKSCLIAQLIPFKSFIETAVGKALHYRWTLLIWSPIGKGKWFKLMGVRIDEVKISSKALQGE